MKGTEQDKGLGHCPLGTLWSDVGDFASPTPKVLMCSPGWPQQSCLSLLTAEITGSTAGMFLKVTRAVWEKLRDRCQAGTALGIASRSGHSTGTWILTGGHELVV